MNRTIATIADLAAIAVAGWALWSDRLIGILPGNLLQIIAVIVLVTSVWRLWRRHVRGA